MKVWFWILPLVVICAVLLRFWLQRMREQKAQKQGLVLYGTVLSLEPVKVFGKPSPMVKVNLWVQQPGGERRNVSLSTRIAAGQTVAPGIMVPLAIDLKDPQKVYPAGPEAVKRAVLTGSREQRRQMKKQRM